MKLILITILFQIIIITHKKEINKIENLGDNLVVTTEKDFQKIQFLERKNKWSYLEIEVKFLEKEDEFDNLFRKKISM
jgi:tetraacyldisaccharide-1-P 4'-kinase